MNTFRDSGFGIRDLAVWVIVFILFLNVKAAGQKLEIFGYFEPQLMGAKIKNEFYPEEGCKMKFCGTLN